MLSTLNRARGSLKGYLRRVFLSTYLMASTREVVHRMMFSEEKNLNSLQQRVKVFRPSAGKCSSTNRQGFTRPAQQEILKQGFAVA